MYERTYHKAVLKTEEGQSKKNKKRLNWRLIAGSAAIAVVLTGIVFLVRAPALQVKHVTVTGANVVDPGDVTEFIDEQLHGNHLFVLPKTSIFLVPTHTLEKNIKKHFSRIQTVTITRSNFSTLSVSITEYQGVYLWCTDEMTCYFMDQNGVAFAPAPYFSGDAYPKIFAGSIQDIPFQVLNPMQMSMIATIMSQLPIIGITPAEFHFVSEHEVDIDFNHNGNQAQLMFDPTTDIKQALTDLYTGLRTNPLATDYRNSAKVLQYIDLRFSNRVVYKFQ